MPRTQATGGGGGGATAHTDLTDMPDTGSGSNTDHDARYLLRSLVNGTFQESFDALVTSDGATVTMSLEQSGGGDLTMQFSDAITTLDTTPAVTIALTAGTDVSPTENFIYIPQSTKVLTKSTSDWSSEEHIKVGYFFVPSATFAQSDGVYVNQNWNDHLTGTDSQGHLAHMAERSRRDGAYYFSGIDGGGTTDYVTITTNVGTPDNVTVHSTAGVIYQMHKHTVPAVDTSGTDKLLVANDSTAVYDDIQDLNSLLTDADGDSMSGNFFNLVLWGVANKSGEFSPFMINLPNGSYANQADATADVDGEDVFTIPAAFLRESSTGFLIARITLKHSPSSGGTWSHISTIDLRGQQPVSAAGVGTSPLSGWTDAGTVLHPSDTTDDVVIGATTPVSSAKFSVDGDDDQIQCLIQAHSTQTAKVFEIEDDTGTDVFTVDKFGATRFSHHMVIGKSEAGVDYSITFDGFFNNGIFNWVHANDYFSFSDDILMFSAENLYFRDTDIFIVSPSDGNLTIDSDGGLLLNPASTLTIGDGSAGVDYQITFDGETNDGVLKWMEDEDQFRFEDQVQLYRNDAAVDAQFILEQDSTGDATMDWLLTAGQQYRAYIDNSDGDNWKLDDVTNTDTYINIDQATGTLELGLAGDTELGDATERALLPNTDLRINLGTSSKRFNDAYIFGLRVQQDVSNVSDPPTDAELDSAFGTPATLGRGFIATLDDADADTDVWLVYTSDVSWFYLQGTKAV